MVRTGWKEAGEQVPALEIRVLICGIPWVMSVAVNVSGAVVVENGRMRSVLVPAFGRAVKAAVGVSVERIVAITEVLGRKRRVAVRPRPIPKDSGY